jgi:hypothetical protein
MDLQPLQNVDYLSFNWQEEDLFATAKYIRQHKLELKRYHRLQYALWRNWAKQRSNQLSCPPSTILWSVMYLPLFNSLGLQANSTRDKDSDTTWLYGPLMRFQSHQHGMEYPTPASPNSAPLTSSQDALLNKTRNEDICLFCSKKSWLSNKTESHSSKPRRVKFSSEVRQAVCLPSDPYWYWYWWNQIRNEELGLSQERMSFFRYIFTVYSAGKTILNVPSSTLEFDRTLSPYTFSGEDCGNSFSEDREYVFSISFSCCLLKFTSANLIQVITAFYQKHGVLVEEIFL